MQLISKIKATKLLKKALIKMLLNCTAKDFQVFKDKKEAKLNKLRKF